MRNISKRQILKVFVLLITLSFLSSFVISDVDDEKLSVSNAIQKNKTKKVFNDPDETLFISDVELDFGKFL